LVQEIISYPRSAEQKKNSKSCSSKQEVCVMCYTPYSLNVLMESDFFCIDGTFSYAPKEFFQQVEIMAFNRFSNEFEITVVFYLTSKTFDLYYRAFSSLQTHVMKAKSFILRPKRILIDFEGALVNVCKMVFQPKELNGCYFHAVSNWWKRVAKEVFLNNIIL